MGQKGENGCRRQIGSSKNDGWRPDSVELRGLYPGVSRGLSERSVRRYVQKNNMRAVSKHHKLEAVQKAVSEVSNVAYYMNVHTS